MTAFCEARRDPPASERALDRAEATLTAATTLAPEDEACLFARLIDHRAWPKNRPRTGPPDHEAARVLYERIPPDGPPFARCRRGNGLGWTHLRLGDRPTALAHARASVEAAGDAGSLRLRAMALNLLAQTAEGEEAHRAHSRALEIAARLEDEALRLRFGGTFLRGA